MKILILAFSLLLLAACDTLQTNHDFNPEFDFSQLKTFTILAGEINSNDIKTPLLSQHINRSIKNYLVQKGYKYKENGNTDFSVRWFASIDKKIYHQQAIQHYNNYGYGGSYGSAWTGGYDIEFKKGSLVIDISEGTKQSLIWRGHGEKYDDNVSGEARIKRLDESINRMMTSFPPK